MSKLEEIIFEGIKGMIRTDSDGSKYIAEEDINKMCSNVKEQDLIKKIAKEHNIIVKIEMVEKKDRPKLVREYEYGTLIGSTEEFRDKPVYSVIEYDHNGNIIYENYDNLKEFLEEEFLPNNITYKRQVKSQDSSGRLYPFLQLNMLVKLGLSDREMEYALNYLNDIGVYVRGIDSSIDQGFENYDYYVTYRSQKLADTISKQELLNKIKEYKETGDLKLRNEIITVNLRLARWCAYKYAIIYGANIDELSSYAYEGLMYALEKFDWTLGFSFSTYAVLTIKGFIQRGFKEMKYGREDTKWIDEFVKAKRIVEKENGCTLEDHPELADDINRLMTGSLGEYDSNENMLRINYYASERMFCLDDLIERESDELIDEKQSIGLDDYIDFMDLKQALQYALSTLTPLEAAVISLRFGLKDNEPKTIAKVGKMFNLSVDRVRNIEEKAIKKLRHPICTQRLRGF